LDLAVVAGAEANITANVGDFGHVELLFARVRILMRLDFLKCRQNR
jgi:hypothetical protein